MDVPLSYGFIHVNQPTEQPLLNTVEIYWDPVKEVGVYIKVYWMFSLIFSMEFLNIFEFRFYFID